jgi:predicted site-specific integrase-resolvase
MSEPVIIRPMNDHYMTPAEVAAFFGVTTKAIWRWSVAGKLPHIRTMGSETHPGHRRYLHSDMERVRARLGIPLEKEAS